MVVWYASAITGGSADTMEEENLKPGWRRLGGAFSPPLSGLSFSGERSQQGAVAALHQSESSLDQAFDLIPQFVRWTSNDFGTVLSRIDILRAVTPEQPYSTVPWITPGGESLLRLSGWPKVERALQMIDVVEALGIDPADAAPDYWHHVHNRLSVNETPRPYTRSRHQAWLHRRRVTS
jgi:hypothetical protein